MNKDLGETRIKLWKENRVDKEYDLSFKTIKDVFVRSKYFKDWKNGNTKSNLYYSLIWFITAKDGLNSAFEKQDFENLYSYIEKEVENIEKD